MSKRLILSAIAGCMLFITMQSEAAFTLSNTRVVIQTGSSSSIEVLNDAPLRFGMQAWAEDEAGNDPGKKLIVTPALLGIDAKKKAVLRLLSFGSPGDKEQLYYLNVQEIPPKPKNNGQNQFLMAVRSKIKILVRPARLFDSRRGAEKNIEVTKTSSGLHFKNPTPFYFAITTVTAGGKDNTKTALGTFAPMSSTDVHFGAGAANVTLRYLEDTGAARTITLPVR